MNEDHVGEDISDELSLIHLQEEKKQTSSRQLPQNKNNSCFMDAVLTALFRHPNSILEFFFLGNPTRAVKQEENEIRKNLHEFTCCIRGLSTTTNITSVIERICQLCRTTGLLEPGLQHDAGEFLSIIVNLLGLHNNVNNMETQVFATNDLLNKDPEFVTLTTNRYEPTGIIAHVTQLSTPNLSTSSLLQTKEDSGVLSEPLRAGNREYHRMLTFSKFVPSLMFLMIINRTHKTSPSKIDVPVQIEERLEVNGLRYRLHSIVLHKGQSIQTGHYISLVVNSSGEWFSIDDLSPGIEILMGRFQETMNKTAANSLATILCYTI